ncbi:MAG: hypothetical protein K5629_00550 [Eubacteriales bacterium]|nr:hypothetical protein [Eubacteriales bacterium]
MMISPKTYVEELKDTDFKTLIEERNQLMEAIEEFEEVAMSGERTGEGWTIMPSPDVIYKMNLQYLAELCILMCEKYNNDLTEE